MTQRDAREYFDEYIKPSVPKGDIPALDEAWGFYIDSLHRDGKITDKQYNNWTRS